MIERVIGNLGIRRLDPAEVNAADPWYEVKAEIQRGAYAIDWLEDEIASLDPSVLTMGVTRTTSEQGSGTGQREGNTERASVQREARLHVLVEAWQRERRDHFRVCAEAIKIGLEERSVQLEEQHGRAVASIVRAVADALPVEFRRQVIDVGAQVLRGLPT